MENFKNYMIKTFLSLWIKLRIKFLEKWETILLGCLLVLSLKIPFRFLFEQLDFLFGYNLLCGVYALLFMELISNFKGKEVYNSKSRLLIKFIIAVFFSYLAVNYNILQLIFNFFFNK